MKKSRYLGNILCKQITGTSYGTSDTYFFNKWILYSTIFPSRNSKSPIIRFSLIYFCLSVSKSFQDCRDENICFIANQQSGKVLNPPLARK